MHENKWEKRVGLCPLVALNPYIVVRRFTAYPKAASSQCASYRRWKSFRSRARALCKGTFSSRPFPPGPTRMASFGSVIETLERVL